MRFETEDGSVVLELQDPAQYPLTENTKLIQAKERSATGQAQVEDFSVSIGTYTYVFKNMSNDDYAKLINWFVLQSVGQLNKFYIVDALNNRRLGRFVGDNLNFKLGSFGLWSGSFTFEVD